MRNAFVPLRRRCLACSGFSIADRAPAFRGIILSGGCFGNGAPMLCKSGTSEVHASLMRSIRAATPPKVVKRPLGRRIQRLHLVARVPDFDDAETDPLAHLDMDQAAIFEEPNGITEVYGLPCERALQENHPSHTHTLPPPPPTAMGNHGKHYANPTDASPP